MKKILIKRKLTEEHKRRISQAKKGIKLKLSDEQRKKRREIILGGKNPFYGKTHTKEVRKRISEANKGKTISEEVIRKRIKTRRSNGWYKDRENYLKKISGKKSHLWKGGITALSTKIRNSSRYVSWRTSVYERDNYTCKECDIWGGNINAHHIIPFAECMASGFKELIYDIKNGLTLCVPCHRKTDSYRRPNKRGTKK